MANTYSGEQAGDGWLSGLRGSRIVLFSLLLGCTARVWLVWVSPAHKSPWDHHEYVRWGIQASTQGLLSMYTSPPPESDALLPEGRTRIHHREQYICNYPPLAVYLLRLKGALHGVLDPERVSNTRSAHFVFSAASMVADLLLAWGCLAVTGALGGRRAGEIAFAVAVLMPPIMLDSCLWQQTDSWVAAPAVWMLYAMIRRRWLLAGLLWGTALGLKTQGILLAPIWAFAWLLAWRARVENRGGRDLGRIIGGVLVALLWLNACALPFWLSSGSAWLHNSVIRNLRDESPRTTLKAFNIWYADLLLSEDPSTEQTWLGIKKDKWGKGLAVAGLLAAGLLSWQRRQRHDYALLLFAGLWLLLVVMLPTRVHERYLLLCLPLLTCLACLRPGFWVGVVPLVAVATFQVAVYQWMTFGAGMWPEYLEGAREFHGKAWAETPPALQHDLPSWEEARELAEQEYRRLRAPDVVREWVLTVVALWGAGAVLAAAAFTARPREKAPPRPVDGSRTAG
ncbi:MAG: DUF2029 domain-containing protein [Phycisphaerales bacterium]|nr:MAG: DUF2029 domain-containing protein [Phycisphaerales bacterium]